MTQTAQRTMLSAADRCDRCGAQAYIQVELLTGAELLFCAHHGRQHLDKLLEVALVVYDETDRLIEKRVPAWVTGAATS